MASANGVADTNLTQNSAWENDFKNRHLTDIKGTEFVSAFRTVIYARPCDSGTDEAVSDIGATDSKEFKAVGVVQAYNWNEQREVQRIFELGSDIPYVIPGRTIGGIQLSRIMINGNDIVNALYDGSTTSGITSTSRADDTQSADNPQKLNSIKDITVPMDILFVAFATNGNGKTKYSRVFKNCHIESRQESIGAGQVILAESCSIIYETIVGVTLPTT